MNPRVAKVKANVDHTLTITFTNGETRAFDMKPYLQHGVFTELQDIAYFRSVRAQGGTVRWPHDQDVCPDTLYEDGVRCRVSVRTRRIPSVSRRAK